MTPIAEQLIHNLRHDSYTRQHFSITAWRGKNTCNTVGCIAGTALIMSGDWKTVGGVLNPKNFFGEFVSNARLVLGIEFHDTAFDLFLPNGWTRRVRGKLWYYDFTERPISLDYSYLPEQARPSPDYVAEMREWTENFDNDVTPDQAARALELVTKDELPYCDWKRAVEEA